MPFAVTKVQQDTQGKDQANFGDICAFVPRAIKSIEMQMPDDVAAALERFQTFIGRYSGDEVIDEQSGFTVADGILIAGEVEMSAASPGPDENPID